MKKISIILSLFSISYSAITQQKAFFFTIEGQVKNVENGKIYLVPVVSNEKYYGNHFFKDSAIIKDGNFTILRKVLDYNTYAYRFLIQSQVQSGITDFIFISGKNIFVEIDSVSMHISPKNVDLSDQKEMTSEYNPFFYNFVASVNAYNDYEEALYIQFNNNLPKEKMHELENTQKQLRQQSDSLFGVYAANHPASQVTLWKMIERLENLGYHSEYKNIFTRLTDKLQKSFIGRILYSNILETEVLRNGSVFPALRLENTRGENLSLNTNLLGKTFTLVDFWFTDCNPCRQQFPEFKSLFSSYKDVGFQIIGIATDVTSKINAWKNLIKKDMLNWKQLLDKNGKVTQQLGINEFPTNFLLDKNGAIIQKNITLSELEYMLKEHKLRMEKIKNL